MTLSILTQENSGRKQPCDSTTDIDVPADESGVVNHDNLDTGSYDVTAAMDEGSCLDPEAPTLTDKHREDLYKSGLSDEQIAAAGFRSIDAEHAKRYGFPCSGMLIPYPDCGDYCRLKTDSGEPKYLSRAGSRNHLYIPPATRAVLQDAGTPLLITEGEKKALKADQEGFRTIGLSGVWNWKTKAEGLLPEFKEIKWKGRKVYVVFDSDLYSNSDVQAALRGLARELEERNAIVRIVRLPAIQGEKVGLDDFLHQHGTQGRSELQKLIEEASPLFASTLNLIQPGQDPAVLQEQLENVYRAAQLYPTSLSDFAREIRKKMTAAGYSPPTSKEIQQQIRKVKPFVSVRTGESADLEVEQTVFRDEYFPMDSETGYDDPAAMGFVRIRSDSRERITNFTVRVSNDIEVIDDLETNRAFDLRISGPTGTHQTQIDAGDYADNQGLKTALVKAGGTQLDFRCSGMDELRSAIASASEPGVVGYSPVAHSKLTRRFGWHEDSAFLVPGGYVDDTGFHERTASTTLPDVDLSGTQNARHLRLSGLPEARLGEMKEFVGTRFMQLQPSVVMNACMGMIPLALLYKFLQGRGRFALWLLGRTGTGKSFLGRLIQSFFGDFCQGANGITTWASTANFIQAEGYHFANAVYLVDDYKPALARPADVSRILQNYADETGRGRLQKDATANMTRPIRGMMLSTGEDLPENNAAAIARSIVLKIPCGSPDVALGNECLQRARDFPGITADLVQHILNQDWHERFPQLVAERQTNLYAGIAGRGNAPRIASNIAMLSAGFRVFAEYMADVWQDHQTRIDQFDRDLEGLRDQMLVEVGEQSGSQVFLRQLCAIIESGRACLLNQRESPDHVRGSVVGYRLESGHVGLIMPEAIRLVDESLRASGQSLGCTRQGLIDQLTQDGLVVETSRQIRDGNGARLSRMTILQGKAIPRPQTAEDVSEELADCLDEAMAEKLAQPRARKHAESATEKLTKFSAEVNADWFFAEAGLPRLR